MSAPPLRLNLIEGSVAFGFSPTAARDFQTAIAQLMENLKTIASRTPGTAQTKPYPSMEYQYSGDVFLECFCNPNIWPSPFAAKVLITVRDDRIRLTTEAELTRILEDLNEYLEAAR
jgi:hypothetical protein